MKYPGHLSGDFRANLGGFKVHVQVGNNGILLINFVKSNLKQNISRGNVG